MKVLKSILFLSLALSITACSTTTGVTKTTCHAEKKCEGKVCPEKKESKAHKIPMKIQHERNHDRSGFVER